MEYVKPFDEAVTINGESYIPVLHGRTRSDATWEGLIEFRPVDGRPSLFSPIETKQASQDALLYWATGLSTSYFEGALRRAHDHPSSIGEAQPTTPPPTPVEPLQRAVRLSEAEQFVIDYFSRIRTTRVEAKVMIGASPFSGADMVRAFEDLEKRWRYLIRSTEEGLDLLVLTVEGAAAARIPAVAGGTAHPEPPKSTS